MHVNWDWSGKLVRKTKKYKVQFEVLYKGLFFHFRAIVFASNKEEAKKKGLIVFNSHEDNRALNYTIVNIEEYFGSEEAVSDEELEKYKWQTEEISF